MYRHQPALEDQNNQKVGGGECYLDHSEPLQRQVTMSSPTCLLFRHGQFKQVLALVISDFIFFFHEEIINYY